MNKEELKEKNSKAVDTNYDALQPFIPRGLSVFEVESVKQEVLNCLMINLYQASVTLTNHLLERGLKLALIHNEVGVVPVQPEEWETKLITPNQKYGSLHLNKAIELCASELLIVEEEKQTLNIIREEFRNGFSHADMTKILKDFPSNATYHIGSFSTLGVLKQLPLSQQTQIHVLQPIFQEDFARDNALLYFKYVYKLLIIIEKRLIDKFTTQANNKV